MSHPSKDEILSRVEEFIPEEPPPGPFCVTHIFGDPRLVEFARAKADGADGQWHQVTVWLQSEGEMFPPPPSKPEWLNIFDMSDLWPNPNPMGRPQGLMYLIAASLWRGWKRPFGLSDIDVYFGMDHLKCIRDASNPHQPVIFARQKHPPHVFGGIGYVHGAMREVADRIANKMSGQTPRYKTHWAEKMFFGMYSAGLVDLVNIGVLYEEWEDVLDRNPDDHWRVMKQRYENGEVFGPW